jgi:O-antigen/teichoic acid export membrane protein
LSIQKKVLLNTGSQIYMALLAVVTLPFYISLMGKQAYGLIAFFIQLQTAISILDVGVSATVSRNMTLFKVGKLSRRDFLESSRSLEFVFYLVGIIVLLCGLCLTGWITSSWLEIEDFDPILAQNAVKMIVVVVVLRWLQTFYRAAIFGAERIEWVSWFNIFISTIRVVAVIPFLIVIEGNVLDFFIFQIAINFVELFILFFMVNYLVGYSKSERFGIIRGYSIILAVKSSAVIGFTSLIWTVIAQVDKFIASGVTSLTAYAAYSIVITVASVMVLLSAPLIYAIGPMMARLIAKQQVDEAVSLFRNATLFTVLLLSAAFAVTILWGTELLLAWTNDEELVELAHPLLPAYLSGTFFFALNYLSYSINYALGDFSRRLKYSLVTVVIYIPILLLACHYFNEYGLIYSWLIVNVLFFFVAQPLLYNQLKFELFRQSLFSDIILPFIGCFGIVVLTYFIDLKQWQRWQILVVLGFMFFLSLGLGLICSRARLFVKPFISKLFGKACHGF